MAVRGRAVYKNQNPTLYMYRVISPQLCICHNGCLSEQYLGKYTKD